MSRTPYGPWSFFYKWNFGEINSDGTATGNMESMPRAVPLDAQDIEIGKSTKSFMLDAIAGRGAIILPFSYKGFGFDGRSAVTFYGYGACLSNPLCPLGASVPADAKLLHEEIDEVAKLWPSSKIIVLGHSQGGFVAYTWFKSYVHPWNFDAAAFSLDSPINGVCVTLKCINVPSYPNYPHP
jgi:hypothetical protein